jgi:peptide/nickel transport system ATP-binding protein
MTASAEPVLRVRGLRTRFELDEGVLQPVDGVDLDVGATETVALIGESGSGKSVLAQSILRIVPPPGRLVEGQVVLRQQDHAPVDIAQLPAKSPRLREVRGGRIAMVFQEPMTCLSPVHTIGNQIMEGILLHCTRDKKQARAMALEMLARVGISGPEQRLRDYPHQLSGGMRQRVMIAMALVCRPALLIADEPTTALDVTVQAQIIELMQDLQREFDMAILYITHDLAVVAEMAERVYVIYLGSIVETAPAAVLLRSPLHPYTAGLLRAVPRLGKRSGQQLDTIPGTVPAPFASQGGCRFAGRCPRALGDVCERRTPPLCEVEPGHYVRCFRHSGQEEGARHGR